MYASVGTIRIKPGQVAAFTHTWATQIEPMLNQSSTVVDLYALVNAESHTVMIIHIYTDEATALICEMSAPYQQLYAQLAHLVIFETVTQTGYTVIST